MSPRRAARIAGWSYLGIFGLAVFANFVVREGLVDPDDPAATASNIAGSEALFRAGIVALLVVCVLDLVVAWALQVYFRSVDDDVARLAGWFRLAYAVLLGASLAAYIVVVELVTGDSYDGAEQRDVLLQLSTDVFDATWLVGLALFGLHLVLVGYLVRRSGHMPPALGIVLALAGVGYVTDTLAHVLLAGYDDLAGVFLALYAIPSFVGELWLTLWLLTRGTTTTD